MKKFRNSDYSGCINKDKFDIFGCFMGKSKPVTLGKHSFAKKEDAKKYVRDILDRNLGKTLKGDDFDVALELFELHPDYEEKVGAGVKSIYVQGTSKDRCFYIKYTDNKPDEDFSYKHCFETTPETLIYKRRQKAYRNAVQDQIDEYRQQCSNPTCYICGAAAATALIEVDHDEPQFIELTQTFERGRDYIPVEFDKHKSNNSKVFRENNPQDKQFADEWSDFHRKTANLRFLCKTCNLTRKKHRTKEH